MQRERVPGRSTSSTNAPDVQPQIAPGKQTLVSGLAVQRRESAGAIDAAPAASGPAAPATLPGDPRPTLQMLFGVQRDATTPPSADPEHVHAAAAQGTASPASKLPFADQIQRAFGHHDVSGVQAHVGPEATASARAMGARAYATGSHVVLGDGADLHTVAHEAAHVVQQRGGVQLKGGVGEVGDAHERNADAVADLVVQGKSAEALLDPYTGGAPGSSVQHAPDRGAPVQAMWPFDGPSIFSSEFWSGGGQQQQGQQGQGQQGQGQQGRGQQGPSLRELRRIQDQQARLEARDRRRDEQERLRTLAPLLRQRLVAVENQLTNAAALLPARARLPWATNEPDAVEASVRPEIQLLPNAGQGRFQYVRDADEAEQRTAALEQVGAGYHQFCTGIAADLVTPCRYFTTYAASLGDDLTGRINAACLRIRAASVSAATAKDQFRQLMAEAKTATAITSDGLYEEMQAGGEDAQQRVHRYFQLGRLRIGHNRSFYASEHDAPAGQFGGEWALTADDPNLKDVAKAWVYHTHCQAVGDKSTHTYTHFIIKRGVGASHIKRIADRMEGGVSITVNYPAEFDRIEGVDRDRFLGWAGSSLGQAALKKQKS
jgi:hypothetical protein